MLSILSVTSPTYAIHATCNAPSARTQAVKLRIIG